MEKFLLLIRQDLDEVNKMTSEEYHVRLNAMLEWVSDLTETGNFISAEPLTTKGKYVSNVVILSDGPFIEAKEAVSGYFFIHANDIDHAVSLAQMCPQIITGSVAIEIRPVR